MNPIDALLPRLDKLHGTNGKYQARCPAHEDRSPSLSIREADDGRVLIHCHAGCEPADIVESVGLTLGDLFPDDLDRKPRGMTEEDFRIEQNIIRIAKAMKQRGEEIKPIDLNRVELAVHRLKVGKQLGVLK